MVQYGVIIKVNGTFNLELRHRKSRSKSAINITGVDQIIENFNSKRYALLRSFDNLYIFINEMGESVFECDKLELLREDGINGYLVAKYDTTFDTYLWGYLDEDLNELIRPKYVVRKKLHWGYCFYDIYNKDHETIYILQKDGKVEKVR